MIFLFIFVTYPHMGSSTGDVAIPRTGTGAGDPFLGRHRSSSTWCPEYQSWPFDSHWVCRHIFWSRYPRHRPARNTPTL